MGVKFTIQSMAIINLIHDNSNLSNICGLENLSEVVHYFLKTIFFCFHFDICIELKSIKTFKTFSQFFHTIAHKIPFTQRL